MLDIYPAIDLKDGACVRLLHGDMAAATVYNENARAQAVYFEQEGFDWLHIVDLDGAFAGRPENAEAVKGVLSVTSLQIQLGGGIRTMKVAEQWMTFGVARIILGTVAVTDPGFVKEAARMFPGQIAVGIDARAGYVATEGWARTSQRTTEDIAKRFEDSGVAALIFTDIGRDGALAGVNIEATDALARAVSIPVIASGGVASPQDIKSLRNCGNDNIRGVIIGRALYDGRITPGDALRVARGQDLPGSQGRSSAP